MTLAILPSYDIYAGFAYIESTIKGGVPKIPYRLWLWNLRKW